MSLGNLFQAKLVDGEKETKMDLFRLNFSTSYNFFAEELIVTQEVLGQCRTQF